MSSKFAFLSEKWPRMAECGSKAEEYLQIEPGTSAAFLVHMLDQMVQAICEAENILLEPHTDTSRRIKALWDAGVLPEEIHRQFRQLYRMRCAAVHGGDITTEEAASMLQVCHACALWLLKKSSAPGVTQSVDKPLEKKEAVTLEVTALPVLNYAMQQNGAVAVRSVTIHNNTDAPIENAQLEITAVPAFSVPFTTHIDLLNPHKPVTLTRPGLKLDAGFLAATTEKLKGALYVRLMAEEKELAVCELETTVLAFDQWQGLGHYPELLAAFVTPNHPQLATVIARATEFLGQWTGDTSMDGYQSQDPNRALHQAGAIYSALRELSIAYAVPPASFEDFGQRVRLCDAVLQQKLGTCLDLTLLYASCLEAVGLHPLLISTPGHIFTGVWLEDQMFPESVQDDGSLITKRLAEGVNEIAVVETTSLASGRAASFDEARAAGEKNFTKQVDLIIDVRRARLSGVSPLPVRVQTAAGWSIHHAAPRRSAEAPQQLTETIRVDGAADEEQLPKKAQWERKLLDLGLRNTLINLRMTKTQLPILTDSLDALENALADGSDFTILPRPTDLHMGDFSFDALDAQNKSGIVQAEFENKRLRSILTEGELSKTIKELYRSARTALEENGANTLYLALGMLRWFETKRSTKARYAPVILIPIEMVRRSAAQGYVIRLRDDEPQMNITLLEKLKQDFGILVNGVDPLPADEHGVDIRRVLTILRQAVMEQPHWDVLETACIGIFSFSQFVMWNDIRNRTEDLMRNKIVRSLIDGRLVWDAQPLEIGTHVDENDVLLPMPADASQLYAIRAACSGQSFVLHGPPGTGKSQTITSLIANALAAGKRVLFVAEKMAALEVVQKRLDNIGIGPFCLELHSNRSKKRDVLEQLRLASEVTKSRPAESFAAKAEQLRQMRGELDGYARQLHRVLPCGSDLHTLIGEYEAFRDAADVTPFARAFIQPLTPQALEQQALVLEQLVAAGREIGHPHAHPLQAVGCSQYTQSLRGALSATVEAYITQLNTLAGYAQPLLEALGETAPTDSAGLQRLVQIAVQMACWYDMPSAWAKTDFPQLYFDELRRMCDHYSRAKTLRQQLMQRFRPQFLQQDGAQLLTRYNEVAAQWFLPRFFGINGLCKQLNLYALSPVDKEDLHSHLITLHDYQQQMAAADSLFQKYGRELGAFYAGQATDWQLLAQLAAKAQTAAQALYKLFGSYHVMNTLCGKPELKPSVMGLWSSYAPFAKAKNEFDQLLGIRQYSSAKWLDSQLTLCRTVLEHAGSLKEWIAWVAAAQQARQLGLDNIVSSYEQGLAHDEVMHAYRKAMLQGLITAAIDDSGELNSFSGAVFSKKIEQYKRADQEWAQLSRQEVYCRLAAKVPNFTLEAAHSSELGILQRAIKSGGRGTSIRKLFDQIPNLLPRLCPCMLMSPISAAQYLDPKREPFDIVVFDEASQLPTCKAVGVLARGKDAVIVGDPKQMPPTSFFAVNTVDEDNLEAEDLESILDDCLALNMPQSHLLWHYRSRHESLIAFSNSHFYENKLFTFPSVNDRESKVRLVPVDGVFERGSTRRNRAEAEAVVEELKRRCHDEALSGQSVGVVTFNISQQNLIDDLLSEACTQDPELEKWAFGADEPVFIKNLENVQGDERDVILFSVGYGPDENGKVYMNFGPLNRDGGWRRLNVAVSRARCEMVVFSTLRADQIDLNRTKSEGVAALREFLEYAEGRALAMEVGSEAENKPSGIAATVCQALRDAGYDTDLCVGRSQYRIDIGVVDPEDPEQYLLGILLDGAAYGASKTTRDREIAQIGVLSGLGWNILRLWCVDWWDNREKELARILKVLKDIQNGKAAPEAPAAEPALSEPVPLATPGSAPLYKAAKLTAKTVGAEEFTEPRFRQDILRRIERVIKAEAPVSASVLTRRVVQSYGISRAGSRIQSHMNELVRSQALKATEQDGTVFYWREDQDPAAYVHYRVCGEEEDHRDVREVPVQEVANAICVLLYEQISMGQEDLLRETAKKLGYTRLGGNVLTALEGGIQCALALGCIAPGANGAFILTNAGTARAEATLQAFRK